MTVGRNDPCPCGGGKKYKKCCLGKEAPARSDAPAGVAGELRQALAGREFGSLAEAQAFAEQFRGGRGDGGELLISATSPLRWPDVRK